MCCMHSRYEEGGDGERGKGKGGKNLILSPRLEYNSRALSGKRGIGFPFGEFLIKSAIFVQLEQVHTIYAVLLHLHDVTSLEKK